MQRDVCEANNLPPLCAEFKERVFTDLKDYLRDVTFTDVNGKTFKFHGDDHGPHDGPPRYTIINFRKNEVGGSTTYDWHTVGTYHDGYFTRWEDPGTKFGQIWGRLKQQN
jgi:hypothetical protein